MNKTDLKLTDVLHVLLDCLLGVHVGPVCLVNADFHFGKVALHLLPALGEVGTAPGLRLDLQLERLDGALKKEEYMLWVNKIRICFFLICK
jgi:hypothetical protein